MNICGFSTNMYGWVERWKMEGKTPDWSEIFNECKLAGLDAVEIDPTSEKLRMIKEYGLTVSASYVGLPLHVPFEKLEVERTVLPFAERLAKAEGKDFLVNADPISWKKTTEKTEDEFKLQGENLSRIAELLTPMGLKVCMHNHASDYHNASGDLKSVVEYADDRVGLCVDSGWAYVAGYNPIEWVNTYPERVFAFHLRNQHRNVPAEDLLEGDIDLKSLLKYKGSEHYSGWIGLELWHPPETKAVRTMTENVKRSLDYLREIIFNRQVM